MGLPNTKMKHCARLHRRVICDVCSETELEELFNSVFAGMSGSTAADRRNSDSFPAPFFPTAATGQSAASTSTAGKTQPSTAAKKRRKKRR